MAALLRLQLPDGSELSFDDAFDASPLRLGIARPGSVVGPVEVHVANVGDAAVDFVLVRAIPHVEAQRGGLAETAEATLLATTQAGAYAPSVDVGTVEAGERASFWLCWAVPADAAPGGRVWALEALGAGREDA